jgi:hypothetical protein
MGVDAYTLWSSVPSPSSPFQFAWYGGMSVAATLSGTGSLRQAGGLTVQGATFFKPWAAFEMRISGTAVTIFSSSGFNTVVAANVVRNAAGNYTVSIPLHPNAPNFIPVVSSICADTEFRYATVRFGTATATESKFVVNIRNTAATAALVDGSFFFHTVPEREKGTRERERSHGSLKKRRGYSTRATMTQIIDL